MGFREKCVASARPILPRLNGGCKQFSARSGDNFSCDRRLFCEERPMPKHKSLTPEEQAEKFRLAADKRLKGGLLSTDAADAAVDAMIRKNIKDHGA
jgi:hypothetical protein